MKLQILRKLIPIVCLLVSMNVLAYDSESGGIYYNITSSENKTIEVTYQGSHYSDYSNVYTGTGGETPSTGVGTKDQPHSVSSAKSVFVDGSATTAWVVGYIVGSVDGMILSTNAVFGSATSTKTNLLISDNPNATSVNECIPVQLPAGAVRDALNLVDNPTNLGKKVKMNGSIEKYFGAPGFKSVKEFEFEFVNIQETNVNLSGISYKIISNREAQVIGIETTNNESIIIPNDIIVNEKKYIVTSIGGGAFAGCSRLTSITIGNSVTSIGYSAFYKCSGLTSITIPNSVTSIGDGAFDGCSGLTSVTIPNSVTSIGGSAFGGCSSLTEVVFNAENCTKMGSSSYPVFKDCTTLTDLTIGENVKIIPNYAFSGCSGLTSVTIPNSVTSIGGSAFSGCSGLTSVTIPNSVTSIGGSAFSGCSGLTSITIPNSVTSIGSDAFDGCSGLTSITIPNSVTQIGNYAFGDCTSLKDLKIEDGTEILELGYNNCSSGTGEGLFYDCPLETVYLGRNLSYNTSYNYGYSPFYNQKALKAITIGNSVTSIGDYAFYNCSGLTSVIIGNSVTSISSSAFSRCYIKKAIWLTNTPPQGYANLSSAVHYVANKQYTSLNNVTIYPYLSSLFEVDGIKYVPVSPSERTCDAIDCAYDTTATNINIENTVSYKGVAMTLKEIKPYTCNTNDYIKQVKINFSGSIDKEAFSGCSAITSAEIKASIIDKEAFYGCSSLETITVNAKSLGTSTFASCATKESAIFEISVQTIGDNSFKGCTKVESITLSDNLISIGDNAFERCSNLKEIVIPDAVKSLGGYAFSGCSSLEDITIGASVATIKESAFSGCSKLPEITIPSNVKTIGNNVFNNCTSLATVVINDRDTDLSFGSNDSNPLFYSCPLDSVYIGGNITYPTSGSKGYSPFYRNTNLRSVVITDKETEISENEFYGCSNLKNISMGDGVETIGKWAFSGCSSLDYFAFGSGMKTIGEEAFSDCTAMTKLISRTTTPPTCGTQALDDINKWVCELFVPQSAVTAYQGANQWKEFFFITGTESSGVESTLTDEVDVSVENGNIVIKGADNAMIEVYSLNGQCVYSGIETTISIAAKGLYVVKVNGKSFKVMM